MRWYKNCYIHIINFTEFETAPSFNYLELCVIVVLTPLTGFCVALFALVCCCLFVLVCFIVQVVNSRGREKKRKEEKRFQDILKRPIVGNERLIFHCRFQFCCSRRRLATDLLLPCELAAASGS